MASFATAWSRDEYAGCGSYSTFQTPGRSEAQDDAAAQGRAAQRENGKVEGKSKVGEEVTLDKHIEALREGLPERRLWFAGEATAPLVGLGTVTGAYWSGERVATRVLQTYGITSEGMTS